MNALVLVALTALALVLLAAGTGLPGFGDPNAPAALHVAATYTRGADVDMHTPNIVTAMIADYRGFDTLGETVVVFTAGLACMLLLRTPVPLRTGALGRPKPSIITDVVARAMLPLIQLFGLYVIFHGHYSPGGGFQGGALLGASVLLARLVFGFERSQRVFPAALATPLGLAGLVVFAGVGLAALPAGGALLDYARVPFGLPAAPARNVGILLVEIGVACTVSGTLISIFDDLARGARGQRSAP